MAQGYGSSGYEALEGIDKLDAVLAMATTTKGLVSSIGYSLRVSRRLGRHKTAELLSAALFAINSGMPETSDKGEPRAISLYDAVVVRTDGSAQTSTNICTEKECHQLVSEVLEAARSKVQEVMEAAEAKLREARSLLLERDAVITRQSASAVSDKPSGGTSASSLHHQKDPRHDVVFPPVALDVPSQGSSNEAVGTSSPRSRQQGLTLQQLKERHLADRVAAKEQRRALRRTNQVQARFDQDY